VSITTIKICKAEISIPYGAIKSGWCYLCGVFGNFISIPYGAIKRKFGLIKITGLAYFNSLWCD